jgi:hypothetical protein
MNLATALNALIPLNPWARCDYEHALDMHEAQRAVYALKRRVIRYAMETGECSIRVVRVERSCKTCQGTGDFKRYDRYDDDYWEYEACRRCGATGNVTLRFLETTIHGVKWHTPRPKIQDADWLRLDWEKAEETDWAPEQPARELTRVELIRLLNEAERAVFGEKMLRWHNGWHASVFDYYLHLGHITGCFVCGREQVVTQLTFGRTIIRPGFKWEQRVCDNCEYRASRWPRQWPANLLRPEWKHGAWITEAPGWPMCCPLPPLAESWDVTEWLARRGIVIGRVPPTEYGWFPGGFCEIVAHRNGSTLLRPCEKEYGWDAPLRLIPATHVRGYTPKLIASGGASYTFPPLCECGDPREHTDHCGCCGEPITDREWCGRCEPHLLPAGGCAPWDRTYFAQHGVHCPFDTSSQPEPAA